MIFEIDPELYENITEIHSIGNNTLDVVTENVRRIKVHAGYTLRGNGQGSYSAFYEELIELDNGDELTEVWKKPVNLGHVNSDSIEGCLRQALGFINEGGG